VTVPILDDAGRIARDGTFFDSWIIDDVCSPNMDEVTLAVDSNLILQFMNGAANLAREVRATGYDWEHASQVYISAARERGISPSAMDRVVREAWRWSDPSISHWSDLSRQWVFAWCFDQFVHVQTGEQLTLGEFHALFQCLSPHPEYAITRFLIEHEWIASVDNVSSGKSLHGFTGPAHALDFYLNTETQ